MTGPGGVIGSGQGFDQPRWVPPLDTASAPGHLVPVPTWVHPALLQSAQPYRAVGRYGQWERHPLLLVGGVVVGVGVVATLVVCLVIALMALVSAHAGCSGARGGDLSDSTYGRVRQEARRRALSAEEAASPLACRPYDQRHATVSTWLNGGVEPTRVAEWAGHSVAVQLSVYAKCIAGQEATARHRLGFALGLPATTDSAS